MKKNLQINFAAILLFLGVNIIFSQQVSINNNIPLQSLIENNLANGCVEISNVSSSINGSSDGFTSYGAFQRSGSNFPLENGIVLSTGNASSGGNTSNGNELSEGSRSWGSDSDIESFIGLGTMANATVIEFDFVSLTDMIQFNYVLASEEYFANFPCNAFDGFVFLIRETSSTGPYQNIAVVPGGSDPVTVGNIHDAIPTQCAASNDQYFDGYGFGDTNYNGRTTVLTAGTTVLPNVQYHVKLVVAESPDLTQPHPLSDTSVFIEANTFTELDLGDDINTCSGSVTLNGEIQNPLASYAWFRDNILISGETNPTLTTSTSGLYRVEISINGNNCIIQDEVNVTIDTELAANPISNFYLCDNDNNGLETFDLSTKNTDVENAVQNLPINYSITYYTSTIDRDTPANNITSPIISSGQTIYVRVEDLNTGCLIYGEFDLIVNPLPIVTQPSSLDVCDNDNIPDSSTEIDLSQKDNQITGSNPDLFVTYHFTPMDANSGLNPISQPYVNTNPTETLYVRVANNTTGCVISSGLTLTINVTNGNTGIVRNTQYIDACDSDHDGYYDNFDLTSVLNDILNGETGFLPPTYHTSQADAESGSSPIANPGNYANTDQDEQVIYLRLEDNTTGCLAIIPIEIHTNLLLTGTNIPATGFAFCDEDDDGSVDVYLNTLENVIANGLPNVSVTYYETEANRDANTMPIDTSNPYVLTSSVTVYLRIENGSCTELSEVLLRINPVVTFSDINPIPYCDNDDDGFTTVDFNSFNDIITAGTPDFNVRYFLNPTDADNGTNQLPQYYDTSSGTFYARIESNITPCYTVNDFQLEVIPAPTVMQPADQYYCNDNNSSVRNIRLQDLIDNNSIVIDPTNLIIEFFDNQTDADNFDVNNPSNNLDKQSYDATTQTIYIRVESTDATACYNTTSFNIVVNTNPDIIPISPYQICVDAGTSDADFYMRDKDLEILNGQFDKTVRYFRDVLMTDEIDKNLAYNSNGAETIYVRVENISDLTCYKEASFLLEIGTNPNYNSNFTNFPPDCQNEALLRTFDLEAKRQEIATGSTNALDIQFYLDENDAIIKANNSLPDLYDSQELQGQFYTRIENTANGCFIIEEVRFNTFPKPVFQTATIDPVCDTDHDGNTYFDLTNALFLVDNIRFGGVTYTYYLDDILSMQIPPNQINSYPVSGTTTIYVQVETDTGCTDSIPLLLQVNLPPLINTIDNISDCINPTNTYDLSQIDDIVVNNTNDVTISYYESSNDALNNTGAYNGKIFNYPSAGSFPIHVRVEDNNNGCPIFTSFNLEINPNPLSGTTPNLIYCDDDFDTSNRLEFNLSDNDAVILGGQNPNDYSVYYYRNDVNNAEDDRNRLDLPYLATNGETIYARIENNSTGCFSVTQFQTIINPLPVIPLNDIESVCINDLPRTLSADTGNSGDTYLWWTGETTPTIEVDLSDLSPDRWVEVTTASPQSCSYRREFDLIQSVQATIEATATADFTDPNTITVTVSGIGDYQYILDNGEPQDSNVFTNVSLGPHIVTIIDLNGCEPIETDVFVIDIPKFVTPNNDRYFDTWHIVGIERLPGTLVYIYNRYGKLLKTLHHTSIGWDGTFNGQNMPADDYWFSADIIHNGESFNIKGHFALKR
ncbi:T9SS type B sorting domain-containing protein [Seonamhaeicola aphaedonensis]|uniref:Gliding motility-associated-like protein n=1 Tax=Seonamhaeicola aphaedonensis TaxID=1461338 RepID=A0A3D9H619_9FLAO|nr:T9SS type B sorting domain-containing protein [Seonamhaeicola aphaedonensis]RED44950.1 gliding motility-associated-like protein [Seonamhaeicola aphaedonensis]